MELLKQTAGGGVVFKIKVQPRASQEGITGLLGDALKLRLTAPPVDGEANQACRRFFAKMFKVPLANVAIETGRASRAKTIKVTGISPEEAGAALQQAVDHAADGGY